MENIEKLMFERRGELGGNSIASTFVLRGSKNVGTVSLPFCSICVEQWEKYSRNAKNSVASSSKSIYKSESLWCF